MNLTKEVEGKFLVRTVPRNTTYTSIMGQHENVDRSFMNQKTEILKVTEGLVYYKSNYGDKVNCFSKHEFDDGNWEEWLELDCSEEES